MDFEERCERFKKNTEKETNIFKYIYRVIFLNKKIEEYESIEAEENEYSKKRLGNLRKYRKMI